MDSVLFPPLRRLPSFRCGRKKGSPLVVSPTSTGYVWGFVSSKYLLPRDLIPGKPSRGTSKMSRATTTHPPLKRLICTVPYAKLVIIGLWWFRRTDRTWGTHKTPENGPYEPKYPTLKWMGITDSFPNQIQISCALRRSECGEGSPMEKAILIGAWPSVCVCVCVCAFDGAYQWTKRKQPVPSCLTALGGDLLAVEKSPARFGARYDDWK